MPRAVLLVLDSVGCGAAPDAAAYGDEGADTLGHIADACSVGRGDRAGLRAGPLRLPHLCAMGLGGACEAATGRRPPGLAAAPGAASFGYAVERSAGKDTPSGHWEMAGTPVPFTWGVFPRTVPAFPPALIAALVEQAGLPGILGDCHASGTEVIARFGAEHLRSGRPICYTSTDSVLQIAAHEEVFGLERLMETCRVARRLCDPLSIGRVIARPFTGADPSSFRRTANRKDFAVPPPPGTLLERATRAGRAVVSIGKTGDIFAHRCTGEERKGASNEANLALTLDSLSRLPEGGLIFANLVDFDSEFGHRRDVPGYAACLEAFDEGLPALVHALRADDLLVITADHGNDPTWRGSDHTRETVPILAAAPAHGPMRIGRRASLADIGATVADHLGIPAPPEGRSWLARA